MEAYHEHVTSQHKMLSTASWRYSIAQLATTVRRLKGGSRKNWRTCTLFYSRVVGLHGLVGLPQRDLAIFKANTLSPFAVPLAAVPEEKRIWRQIHESQDHHLSSAKQLNVSQKEVILEVKVDVTVLIIT